MKNLSFLLFLLAGCNEAISEEKTLTVTVNQEFELLAQEFLFNHKTDIVQIKKEEKLYPLCKESNVVLKVTENNSKRTIEFEGVKLITPFNDEITQLTWKDSELFRTDYILGSSEYNFDEKEKRFMFFKCNKNYSFLALEVHTEEFPAYQMVKLNNNGDVNIGGTFTLTHENFEKIYGKKQTSYFIKSDDSKDVLISKNKKGELLGIYNKKWE